MHFNIAIPTSLPFCERVKGKISILEMYRQYGSLDLRSEAKHALRLVVPLDGSVKVFKAHHTINSHDPRHRRLYPSCV